MMKISAVCLGISCTAVAVDFTNFESLTVYRNTCRVGCVSEKAAFESPELLWVNGHVRAIPTHRECTNSLFVLQVNLQEFALVIWTEILTSHYSMTREKMMTQFFQVTIHLIIHCRVSNQLSGAMYYLTPL